MPVRASLASALRIVWSVLSGRRPLRRWSPMAMCVLLVCSCARGGPSRSSSTKDGANELPGKRWLRPSGSQVARRGGGGGIGGGERGRRWDDDCTRGGHDESDGGFTYWRVSTPLRPRIGILSREKPSNHDECSVEGL